MRATSTYVASVIHARVAEPIDPPWECRPGARRGGFAAAAGRGRAAVHAAGDEVALIVNGAGLAIVDACEWVGGWAMRVMTGGRYKVNDG